MILGPEFLRNVDSKVFHDSLKVLSKKLFFHQHQQSQRDLKVEISYQTSPTDFMTDLEDRLRALQHEHVQDSEDEEQRELGREQSQEPLRGEHVSLQADTLEMLKQVRHVLLYQSFQLVESQLKLLEVFPEEISQTVSKHYLDQDPEGLLLGHL